MNIFKSEDGNAEIHGSPKVDHLSSDFITIFCHVKYNKTKPEKPINSNGRIPRATDEPIYVAIGPYYCDIPRLDLMIEAKFRALKHFVSRGRRLPRDSDLSSINQDSYLQDLREALMKNVNQLRESYGPVDKIWQDNNRFVNLMLLDGVFLLEFLSVTRGNQRNCDYDAADPIFGQEEHMLIYEDIKQDLLMPKNQLPYLVLSTLLTISEGQPEKGIHSILSWMMFAPNIDPGLHLLDMYLKGLLAAGQCPRQEENQLQPQQHKQEHEKISFFNLCKKFGVKCARVQSFERISFHKKTAILQLPTLYIGKQNIREFVNLIVYERQEGTNMDLNSYFYFLGLLIQSPKDVNQLRSQGIIVNYSSCDESLMEMIKEITKEAVQGDMACSTNLVLHQLREYYKKSATSLGWRFHRNLSSFLRRKSLQLSLRLAYGRFNHMPLFVKMH